MNLETQSNGSGDSFHGFTPNRSRRNAAVASGKNRPPSCCSTVPTFSALTSTVTNFGGGNTSAKLKEVDPLTGAQVKVLWVKGSGGDIGSMGLDGFSTLYMDKLLALEQLYRGVEREDEMAGFLPHCTFNLNARAASIDTPLHAYLPFAHVDHVHPDAIIALAASTGGEQAAHSVWGGKIGWLPWQRPGFDLGLRLRDYVAAHPGCEGVILAGHGLICWADTAEACYAHTINLIADAARHLNERLGDRPAFGGQLVPPLADRRAIARPPASTAASGLLTGERKLTGEKKKVGHWSDNAEALEFVGSVDFALPRADWHLLPGSFSAHQDCAPRCSIRLNWKTATTCRPRSSRYRDGYRAYYQRHAGPNDPAHPRSQSRGHPSFPALAA